MAHEVNQGERNVAALVRSALVNRINAERLELWIPADTQWDFREGVLTLGFPTEFACHICRKMLRPEIAGALSEVVGRSDFEIHFVVRDPVMKPIHLKPETEAPPGSDLVSATIATAGRHEDALAQGSGAIGSASSVPNRTVLESHLDQLSNPVARSSENHRRSPKKTDAAGDKDSASKPSHSLLWGTIVAGDSNQLAWTAANLVMSEPGRLTPVLLHGPTGTGKSLILAALAQRMRSDLRMRRVVHLTSEQFTNDFTEGLHGGGLPMFRRKYRDVDALLLDDIHFFVGKKSTLAEVRHTVDNLLRTGKQVVVSADRPLSELSGLGDELLGRLRGGLITPLFPLDEKIRLCLLKQLVGNAAIEIDETILQQLAERVTGDGRLIRGLVHRLIAVASMYNGKLPWEQCWSAVMDLVQATQPVIRMADIERVVCGIFGLDANSLQSKCKMRSVSQPRMLAMFLARKYTPAAYKEIGDYFGQRRHSTVISAEKTVSVWLNENAQLDGTRHLTVREAIRHVEAQLQVS